MKTAWPSQAEASRELLRVQGERRLIRAILICIVCDGRGCEFCPRVSAPVIVLPARRPR